MKEKKAKKVTWLVRMLASEKWSSLTCSLLAIVLMLITASILLLIMGKNPITAFTSFLQGSGFVSKGSYGNGAGKITDFNYYLSLLAPMIFGALSFIVGFKAGLFNIGISGQMVAAGFCATALVGYADIPGVLAKILVVIIGIAVGGLLGALVGFLKYRFNIHEVVSTVMINYIISYLTGFAINLKYVNPMTRTMKYCSASSKLTIDGLHIGTSQFSFPIGIILAVIAAFIVNYILKKTVFGFEICAVGSNRKASRYTGINVGNRLIMAMLISGALAGMAGVTYYLGYTNTIIPKDLPSMGYDVIAVSILGGSDPVGAIASSALIALFENGSNYLSSKIGVAKEIASLITVILLLYSSCGDYFRKKAQDVIQSAEDEKIKARIMAEEEKEK